MGICKWKDGTLYIGDFTKGEVNGYGIQLVPKDYKMPYCEGCIVYVGNWKNGVKSGEGTCYNKNGDVIYFGNFENNMPTETYPTKEDFSTYQFSLIEYDGGNKYLGETNTGILDGYGIYVWANGDLWLGNFKNGQRSGVGIYMFYNAEWVTLNYKDDNCIQISSSEEKRDIDNYNKAARAQTFQHILGLATEGASTIATGVSQIQGLKNSSNINSEVNSGGSTSGGVTNSSGGTSKNTNTSNNKQKADCGQDWITDSRTYSGYDDQLVQMQTYPEKYDNYASKFSDIQSKMRQIRQKWEARGCLITKSPRE